MAVWCKTSVSGRFCKHPVNDMGFPNEVLSGRYYAATLPRFQIHSKRILAILVIDLFCKFTFSFSNHWKLRPRLRQIPPCKLKFHIKFQTIPQKKKNRKFLLCISYWIFKTFKMSLNFTAGWRWRHFSLRSGITTTTSRPCKQMTKRRTKTFDPRLAIIGLNI